MRQIKIEGDNIYIVTDMPQVSLVDMKILKDTQKDEPESGMVRVWVHQSPGYLKFQMRAKVALTDRSQPKNVIATAQFSVHDLRQIVTFFENKNTEPVCRNCKHWRDKAWTGTENDKGIGVCDNPLVDVRPRAKALLASQGVEDWAVEEILQSVRFPDDFGCRFFEPITPGHEQDSKA